MDNHWYTDALITLNPIHAEGLVGLFTPCRPNGIRVTMPLADIMALAVENHAQVTAAEILLEGISGRRNKQHVKRSRDSLLNSQREIDSGLAAYGLVRNFGTNIPTHNLHR